MADDYGCKVRELLPDRFEEMDVILKENLGKDSGAGGSGLPGFALRMAGEKVTGAICDSLDCDVFEILAKAWVKARELHEFKDPAKHPPGETSSVFLGDHKLSAQIHPVLDVSIATFARTKLRFTVELTARFKSAELSIRDGRIVAIGAGDGSASAQLKYGATKLHKELKSKDITLLSPRLLPEPGLAIA